MTDEAASETCHQKNLEACYGLIDEWNERKQSPLPCQLGSELMGDDQHSKGHAVSVQAWTGLMMASEYLHAAATLLRTSGNLYPSAYYGITRPALIGSCNALWILAPDERQERLRRAWLVRKHEAEGVMGMAKDLLKNERLKRSPNFPVIEKTLNASMDSAKTMDDSLIAALKSVGSKQRTTVTEIISAAVGEAFRGSMNAYLESALLTDWRVNSGDAHAMLWPMQIRDKLRRVSVDHSEPGYKTASYRGELDQIARSIYGPVLILQRAWELYELRRSSPLEKVAHPPQ